MESTTIFSIVFVLLTSLVLFLNFKYGLLRDESTQETNKPYSYARTQLTWWTVIVLSGFIAIIFKKDIIPTFDQSILILLGISGVTTIAARLTDNSDQNNAESDDLIQNTKGENFIVDILSDKNGVSIHRLQAVLFNLVFGLLFIHQTLANMNSTLDVDHILPRFEMNNIILLGLSAGAYASLKVTENKGTSVNNSDPNAGKTDENKTNVK